MPRHSKNNTASSVFTYHETKSLDYGTKKVDHENQWACCSIHPFADSLLFTATYRSRFFPRVQCLLSLFTNCSWSGSLSRGASCLSWMHVRVDPATKAKYQARATTHGAKSAWSGESQGSRDRGSQASIVGRFWKDTDEYAWSTCTTGSNSNGIYDWEQHKFITIISSEEW